MSIFHTSLWMLMVWQCHLVDGKTPLYVGGLLGMTNHWWGQYGSFFKILFETALEEISNRTDILPDYELRFIAKDTEGNPGLAAVRLMDLIYEPPIKIAIIGPPLSDEMKTVGQMTGHLNLVQMGILARTSSVKDRAAFSSLYMTNYIDDDLNPVRIAIMKYFDWTRVGTLVYDEEIFLSQINEFHQLLSLNNFTLTTSGVITDITQISEHIKRLQQYNTRIIFAAFRSTKAPEIFCEVYRQGLYGKKYVWIFPGSSMYPNWIRDADESTFSCSKENLYAATNGYMTISQRYLSHEDHTTVSGRTPPEYEGWMRQLVSENPGTLLSRAHPWAYDAAWALGLGLNNSLSYLNGSHLEDFNYTRSDIYDAIKDGMDKVKFFGVSGPVSFNNGRRVGFSFIEKNVGDNRSTYGIFYPDNNSLGWFVDPLTLFEGRVVPKDSVTFLTLLFPSSITATGLMIFLALCGILLANMFLAFNLYFRNNRYIKMSSPYVNNVIILGALMMYASVLISSTDYSTTFPAFEKHVCMVMAWVISFGFTAAFGALFAKTWRVHILFRENNLRKRSVKDKRLFGIVGLLLLIDTMILVPWTIFHPLGKKETKETSEDEDLSIVTTHVLTTCENEKQIYWLIALYVYKGLLLAFGAFMAWETRNISVPSLNDSKFIGFCVYNIVVVCSLFIPLSHFLQPKSVTLKYVLQNFVIIFTTSLVLCILFIPKIKLRNATDNVKFVKNLIKKPTMTSDHMSSEQQTKTTHFSQAKRSSYVETQSPDYLLPKSSNQMVATNKNDVFTTHRHSPTSKAMGLNGENPFKSVSVIESSKDNESVEC